MRRRKKIPDQRSEENRRNMHKGLWTRQYLNNTELSPRKQKKKKKKIPDQRSEENRRNMQKGLWTRQCLNNTELSPRKPKEKKRKKGNHDLK